MATPTVSRRALLRAALRAGGAWCAAPLLAASRIDAPAGAAARAALGLAAPDENGIRLPPGYRSRVVARAAAVPCPGSTYVWHGSPDGGATFATADGGWIYVSNCELPAPLGGVGALRFSAAGALVDAYSICTGTSMNCAGGPTPWGTWLSCEEYPRGLVWECDPNGGRAAVALPALGTFTHEAVAVDLPRRRLYLTEDTPTGGFYRFTAAPGPATRLDLSAGLLEVAQVESGDAGPVRWHAVPDPDAATVPIGAQVAASTAFPGAEGIAIDGHTVYFTTKYSIRVWAYDTRDESLRVYYDAGALAAPPLTGVDNVAISPAGHVLVAEDEGNMQLVGLTPSGVAYPLLQIVGHLGSEIAGPAFDPSGTRLYFSSQRGPSGAFKAGITYEVSGPFAAA